MTDDHDRCEWGEWFFWYWLTQGVLHGVQRAVKWLFVFITSPPFVILLLLARLISMEVSD